MTVRRVALLTAGGFAPCLSTAIGDLVEIYTREAPEVEIIAYQYGYYGLLKGMHVVFGDEVRKNAEVLTRFGGSPIGNSRVKLTNVQDCVDRGLVREGEDPLEVAAEQLKKDGVDVLHTIGGDDTNTAAADLAAYLKEHDYDLTVVGLPKTIDNDIVPIKQSLGAWTAADEASKFAQNIIGEHRSNPRMLIIHEIMGRNCGYLAAQATANYHAWVKEQQWLPEAGLSAERWDVHALYLPEIHFDLDVEASRLRKIMDEQGNVNIFLSEGAGVAEIIEEMVEDGEEPERDAFGHVKLDTINPGQWFAKKFSKIIGAEKVMVQKSGYFSRSAASNEADLTLIRDVAELAVKAAFAGTPGVVGQDEENNDELSVVAFPRIAGHKPFNTDQEWFATLMQEIGQEWSAK
ncbi:pyrophosphate--fructose-6-phosphate 1-phosphotransferase [Arcanobacterium canis]|uniref:Pyrophosphate--fructose 6-phosphate 1-phosphotransferase n=1 Tax=Arcanobacterium canis TaxID=999183 RepID=A0ABY8FYT8_9ACTO|nr:pyrophosphate--fructose-6-phosphate 1-phosphotransferase [Arcanobacterium canis]WFM82723.1 pyrophosphate--fructose-6-phosphate 1-phosphotransferase [Arcanobacterium canis]